MKSREPILIGDNIYLIDGYDFGYPGRTGSYVIVADDITLIETGPSCSIKHVQYGLEQLGLSGADVKNIIVTHIHLDHSGGAGLLLQDCPQASVFVHPKGARYLSDPTRLVQGAKVVFGQDFDRLYHPVIPIKQERLRIIEDDQTLQIGTNRYLQFIHTPGHAKHHLSVWDQNSKSIFTGDVAGIQYESLAEQGVQWYIPTTSPNQFDPQLMLNSMQRIEKLNPKRICFAHFNHNDDVQNVLQQVGTWLQTFLEMGEQVLQEGGELEELKQMLYAIVSADLADYGIVLSNDERLDYLIRMDMHINAMGILDYLAKANS